MRSIAFVWDAWGCCRRFAAVAQRVCRARVAAAVLWSYPRSPAEVELRRAAEMTAFWMPA